MAIKTIDDIHLKQIANAIREKTGSAESIGIDEMPEQIKGIKGGSDPVLQDKTVTPTTSSQTITADSGYDGLDTVTVNAMPTATQATPSITVSSAGKITASATQTAGYVTAGTKSGTKQLTVQAAKTITPSTSSQTAVAKGVYTTGVVTVVGDANLKAENIAEGVSIFGVTGTHSGGGSGGSGGGSVETCTVTMHIPAALAVIGYGTNDVYPNIGVPEFDTVRRDTFTIPTLSQNGHAYPMDTTRIFNNIPVGSVFTFCPIPESSRVITGISVTDNIEFSFVNTTYTTINSTQYTHAVCRCNGDGEITIIAS